MGLFDKRKLKPEEEALVANSDCAFQIESVLYPNIKVVGMRLANIDGRVLKGTLCVGDAVEAYGKTFKILKIQKAFDLLQSIDTDDYVGLAVAYEPINYWKLPFKKGVYKIVTNNNLTSNKKVSVEQPKTPICSRCKKEITDSESKWIGNHRFCVSCASPNQPASSEISTDNARKNTTEPSSSIVRLLDVYMQFKDLANIDKVYGEKIPSLITQYKSLYNQKAPAEEIDKAFSALRNEVVRTLFIVPFHYDDVNEFQNDKVLHCTLKAGNKFNIESIVYRCQNMTTEQIEKLYWTKDSSTNILTADLAWWDISRISGSDGFCFTHKTFPGTMHPQTGNDGNLNFFLCFSGIDQYLKVFGEDKQMHIALFTINDIVEYMSASENISGIIINPGTETHCFIGKEAF